MRVRRAQQSHLKAGTKRKDTKTGRSLVVRPCAVVVADLGLLAQGKRILWIQDSTELEEADETLFAELQSEPGFAPPLLTVLDERTLTEAMKLSFMNGELPPEVVGNPAGAGGLRQGWLADFDAQLLYFLERPTVIHLLEATRAELDLSAELAGATCDAAAVEGVAAAVGGSSLRLRSCRTPRRPPHCRRRRRQRR